MIIEPRPDPNHSHVCGINFKRFACHLRHTESFPRMWDQPFRPPGIGARSRIIPTYVGSTVFKSLHVFYFPNHSHVCGINVDQWYSRAAHSESFPRMWDQPAFRFQLVSKLRIIPTYVGSTLQIAFTLHQAIQHLVVLCYWRMVYDFLDPQYVLALNSS